MVHLSIIHHHICSKKGGIVGVGGNQKGKIIGSETIGNSSFPSIHNVWLVDEVKHNIPNISQLCDSGYDVVFNKNYANPFELV